MNEEIVKKMKEMRLYGMLRAFQTSLVSDTMNNLTKDEMIAQLVEEEWDDRYNRRIAGITNITEKNGFTTSHPLTYHIGKTFIKRK